MSPVRDTRDRIVIIAAAVIIALTAAAFWLSYAHLHTVAAEHGLGISPARAWAWPATLDAFVIAGELLMLRASLSGATDWWAISLVAVGSGGSIALNVFGVDGGDPLAYVTAAVPPTAALLAFGALMRQVHVFLARDDAPPARITETHAAAALDAVADAPVRDAAPASPARITPAHRPEAPVAASRPALPASPADASRTAAVPARVEAAKRITAPVTPKPAPKPQPEAAPASGVQLTGLSMAAAARVLRHQHPTETAQEIADLLIAAGYEQATAAKVRTIDSRTRAAS